MARVKRQRHDNPGLRRFAPLRPALARTPLNLAERASLDFNLDLISSPQGGQSHLCDGNTNDLASDRNTTSRADSSTGTMVSSSTMRLEVERHISPAVGTPSSSSGSTREDAVTYQSGRYFQEQRQGHNNSQRKTLKPTDHATPSMKQTLLGLRPKPIDPSQLKSLQDVSLVSSGSNSSGLPRSGPWSELELRHRVQSNSASPTSPRARYGGRTRSLPKEKRNHANKMRKVHACLRCFLNRITCDDGDPCGPCLTTKMRNWKLGCTRKQFGERYNLLIPDIVCSYLHWKTAYATIETNSERWLGLPFDLPLTQHVGGKIYVQVRELVPLGPKLLVRPIFTSSDEKGDDNVKRVDLISPPVATFFRDSNAESAKMLQDIYKWLDGVTKGSNWPDIYFDHEDKDKWEREILRVICGYHRDTHGVHSGLETALRLSFLTYLLVHPFEVPDEDVEQLFLRLQNCNFKDKKPGGIVSPRAVGIFINSRLGPHFEEVAKTVLKNLEDYAKSRERSDAANSVAFCESFLCLMVLGAMQKSILQYALLDDASPECTITVEQARKQIRHMESELGTFIIELSLCKLRKSSKRKASSPQAGQDPAGVDVALAFFERLGHATATSGEKFDQATELGDIDKNTFCSTNVGRLLRKFYLTVSDHFGEPRNDGDFIIVM